MLVKKNWILTAALVFRYCDSETQYIVTSATNTVKNSAGAPEAVRSMAHIHYIHPEFHIRQFFLVEIAYNNIALLKLSNKFVNCEIMRRLPLPSTCVKAGQECKTVAWDKMYNGVIYEEQETVVDIEECRRYFSSSFGVQRFSLGNMHLCTKSAEKRAGLMVPGQPLMCNNLLYGIANHPNFLPNYSIWTRTDYYVDWINELIPESEEETMDIANSNDYGFL